MKKKTPPKNFVGTPYGKRLFKTSKVKRYYFPTVFRSLFRKAK